MKKLLYLLICIFSMSCFIGCNTKPAPPVELNVMSFNIRYDNPWDSLNSWQYRKDAVNEMIKAKNIDIMGLQEVLANQMNDFKRFLPDYGSVGVGRIDGVEEGEFSAIFYKKDRFEEIESGNFWLSENPEVVGSKGWDGACERIATWVILKDKETEKQFFFLNTHLDHIGKQAQIEGMNLIMDRMVRLSKGLPIIMTGDFNVTPDSEVVKHITTPKDNLHLVDTKQIAPSVSGTNWTFHDFGRRPLEERSLIDYVFVSSDVKVESYEVLPEAFNDVLVSDHSAVLVNVNI